MARRSHVFVSVLFEFPIKPEHFKMEKKMNKLLLESIDRDIEIILDNQVEIKFSFDSYVRGFYVYKDVWYPFNGEKGLECFHEKGKKHTRLRLPCTVMIFHGEILLDMY